MSEPYTAMTLNTAQPTQSATALSCLQAKAVHDTNCVLYLPVTFSQVLPYHHIIPETGYIADIKRHESGQQERRSGKIIGTLVVSYRR